MFKRKIVSSIFFLILSVAAFAQTKTVKGVIYEEETGETLPGATVSLVGSTRGVITDLDGSFVFTNVKPTDQLQFDFFGKESQTVTVGTSTSFVVRLRNVKNELDEVTVVAFGKQRKESVIGSVNTVKPAELKVPSSNLTTALAGRVAGLISYQRSGEPGQDDATFFVRGVTSLTYASGPLILIDGVEMTSSDLARLQPDDIAAFSIMKDATATALYGARGANGVILVSTKEGKEGSAKVNVRYETSISEPTRNLELADPVTYMTLFNEGTKTRDPLATAPFSLAKIDNTRLGNNPILYPAIDWKDMLLKNSTTNQRVNANLSGGGKVARYYIAATFNNDNGLLKVDNRNNFNNNIDLKRYVLRSNVNINVTKSTEVIIRLHASFDDYTGPINGGSDVYAQIMNTSPVLFQPYYEPDAENMGSYHILFGNYDTGNYLNPYAEMVRGYKQYSKNTVLGQFEIKQNLDFITKGLSIRGMASTTRNTYFDVVRSYTPFYYEIGGYDKYHNTYTLNCLNPSSGTEYLTYNPGTKNVSAVTYVEAAMNYDRTFNKKHGLSGLLVFTARNQLEGGATTLIESLAHRNLGLSGRFTYNYDKRYFLEYNFGYNGSERFAEKERFGFFPSAGLGWIISNENWYPGGLKKTLNMLKFKATYGLVGNDAIGQAAHRFFYLSEVNMNDGSYGAEFGDEFKNTYNGVSISKYENAKITWERSYKTNLGIEARMFDMLDMQVDYYTEKRTGILLSRSYIPTTMGLMATPMSNLGEAEGHGIDFQMDLQKSFSSGWWISGRANFTYSKARYTKYEEIDQSLTPWLSKLNQPVSQRWGFVAERLFVDEAEVRNSPVQFGDYGEGDIKYRDINGDGIISDLDMVPIGYPTEPELIYGFGLSTGYKGFDFSVFFQGLGRESFWIDVNQTSPFVKDGGKVKQLLKCYADDHWSENNRDIYALWPRLSTKVVENNAKTSTWFMRDGSFLRLKSLELGYTLPNKYTRKISMDSFRVYLSGTNLWCWSKFDLWDPEQAGHAFNYPTQRVYNIGVQVSF